jgi:hypothetical protein
MGIRRTDVRDLHSMIRTAAQILAKQWRSADLVNGVRLA